MASQIAICAGMYAKDAVRKLQSVWKYLQPSYRSGWDMFCPDLDVGESINLTPLIDGFPYRQQKVGHIDEVRPRNFDDGEAASLPFPKDEVFDGRRRSDHSSPKFPVGLNMNQYTTDPCRVVMANDGTQEYFAVLLNKHVIDQLNGMFMIDATVKRLEERYLSAMERAGNAKDNLDRPAARKRWGKNITSSGGNLKEHENQEKQAECQKLFEELDLLDRRLSNWRLSLAIRQEKLLGSFKDVFRKGSLFEQAEEESVRSLPNDELQNDLPHSVGQIDTDSSCVSMQELYIRTVEEKYFEAADNLNALREALDQAWKWYVNSLTDRDEERDARQVQTRSELDRAELDYKRELTRAIADAETAYANAMEEMIALDFAVDDEYR